LADGWTSTSTRISHLPTNLASNKVNITGALLMRKGLLMKKALAMLLCVAVPVALFASENESFKV
jgi:hypothetical protein